MKLELKGIDTESGVKRIGGNLKSYIRLLNKFTENYRNFEYQYNKSKNEEEKNRLVHSLKGVSGNIGANELYRAAIDLEKALKEKQIKTISAQLNHVTAELEIVTNSVSQIDQSILLEDSSTEAGIITDTEEIKRRLKKLKEYLDKYNSRSLEVFNEIKTTLENKGLNEKSEEMRSCLEKYDFNNALAVLDGIERELYDRK